MSRPYFYFRLFTDIFSCTLYLNSGSFRPKCVKSYAQLYFADDYHYPYYFYNYLTPLELNPAHCDRSLITFLFLFLQQIPELFNLIGRPQHKKLIAPAECELRIGIEHIFGSTDFNTDDIDA